MNTSLAVSIAYSVTASPFDRICYIAPQRRAVSTLDNRTQGVTPSIVL